jgi:type IV pilus assembly protein PilB
MVQISKLIRKKLGEILVEAGVLKEEQLREAHLRQRATGEGLVETLSTLGFLTEMEVARAISKQFGLPYMDASRYRISKEAAETVPAAFQRLNQLAVLDKIGRTLLVAVAGVLNAEVLEKLERASGGQLFVFASSLSRVQAALEKSAAPPAPAAAPEKK